MARSLNKKYFGNRNIGTNGNNTNGNLSNSQNYGDDRIGGEGVASYGSYVAGSGWTTQPTASISAPNIPGGVTATGTFNYKALSFATFANGTGYDVGDTLEVGTGTQTTKARAPVATVVTVTVAKVAGGTDYEAGNTITMSGAGWPLSLIITVDSVDGTGAILTFTVTQHGRRDAAVPANPVSGTTAQGTGIDANGNGATFNLSWGVYAFGTVSTAGSYTVFPSTDASGTLSSVSPASGAGAKANITMGLLSVTNISRGSGYTVPADAALVFSPAATPTNASATAVLTTDSGAVGSATNQENAIVIHANTGNEGDQIGDIIRQVSGRRYKVKAADGIAICKLVADDTPALREAYIIATDDNGNTYYVTKLTAHKALLTRKTLNGESEWLFETNSSAPWTFTTTANGRVIIENA